MKRGIITAIVIVGVVLSLGALLMPALNKARQEARKSSYRHRYRDSYTPSQPYVPHNRGWVPPARRQPSRESYDEVVHNPIRRVTVQPRSTFGTDVDTASYANVRRFLNQLQWPPAGAVRIEEMINYFQYAYPEPEGEHPFSVSVEVAQCPWRPERRLARIGLKAREMDRGQRPPANLVFLLDVSGSMNAPDKLPLVKKAMRMLLHQMSASDRVAIVAYSDSSRVVLPSTSCYARRNVLNAFARLQPGGSTNGGAGIELAYREAAENYIPHGINRVVLCTDGDFNVGITGQDELVTLIESKARGGVFLSVMGFGTGNLKDSNLEKLADHGNGHYGYIDSEGEARKVFVDQVGGALATVAKDVKAQVEFNPRKVQAYRLVGYENRVMDAEDFNDDTKDAGDIGAGHTVTVLYELIPPGEKLHEPDVDPLKYQAPSEPDREYGDELMTVKLRYKEPEGLRSQMLAHAVQDADTAFAQASDDFRFAAAVAAFGMILRGSPHRGKATLRDVIDWAEGVVTNDSSPYRKEFIELAHTALDLQ